MVEEQYKAQLKLNEILVEMRYEQNGTQNGFPTYETKFYKEDGTEKKDNFEFVTSNPALNIAILKDLNYVKPTI